MVHCAGKIMRQQEGQYPSLYWFYSELCQVPIRNDWVRRNILGHKGLCLGSSRREERLWGPGCAEEGAAAPQSCEQKGADSPGLRWWEPFPREQRGKCKLCGNSKCYQVMSKSLEEKSVQ